MLMWFRNDLRIDDNPALHYILSNKEDSSKINAIFFITRGQWQQHDWSEIKIDFICRHAYALVKPLASLNIHLTIVEVDDFNDQVDYLEKYCQLHQISEVVANHEIEVNENLRDQQCLEHGIHLRLFESDVIVPKGKLVSKANQMYRVFTPFKRAWLNYVSTHDIGYLGKPDISVLMEEEQGLSPSASSKWPLVQHFEKNMLANFFSQKLTDYGQLRDIPSLKATSGLSAYLAAGVISPKTILATLLRYQPDILSDTTSEAFAWLNELIWREFYRHLLFHFPDLCKHQCFNEKYQNLVWPVNQTFFNAWCQGKTGYPIVDAAMRQLTQTGWMHNRLRMIVASFLTKHLLIDWRLGERFFMQHLIDGDLAANNGGWQWSAGTGCDAQPYFRIFNPITQSQRFDPNGKFIRKYLPELANIPDKYIHFPHEFISKNQLQCYWPAIVEHKIAREQALRFYR